MSGGELILYTTEDGHAAVHLRAEGGTVWLTQTEIAALFDTTPQNITQHIKAIYAEGELTTEAACKDLLQVRDEGAESRRRAAGRRGGKAGVRALREFRRRCARRGAAGGGCRGHGSTPADRAELESKSRATHQ